MLWTKAFWKGAAERAIKTCAQSAVAFIVIGTTGLLTLHWVAIASVAGAAGLASLLTSIGNADFVAGPQVPPPAPVPVAVPDVPADPPVPV